MEKNTTEIKIDVKNLCSRKLYELLKNAEWQNNKERFAIERELSGRRHYQAELQALKSTQTMH